MQCMLIALDVFYAILILIKFKLRLYDILSGVSDACFRKSKSFLQEKKIRECD